MNVFLGTFIIMQFVYLFHCPDRPSAEGWGGGQGAAQGEGGAEWGRGGGRRREGS